MIIFMETETSCLFYPRPSMTSRRRAWIGQWRAAGACTCLPGGLAVIRRAACQNVDAKRINVRSKVTLKEESTQAQAETMRWRGHADALNLSQIQEQMAEIRMSSVRWLMML